MKRYTFHCGKFFTFYFAQTLGEALSAYIKDHPSSYVDDLTSITVEDWKEDSEVAE